MNKKLLIGIILLSILGVIVSGYLTKVHYSNSSICDFNSGFSCSKVSQSIFAEIKGIPIAVFGILIYSILGILAFGKYKINQKINGQKKGFIYSITHHKSLLIIIIPAVLFSFYLNLQKWEQKIQVCFFRQVGLLF